MGLNSKATILIVDGSTDSLVQIEQLLQEHYHVKLASNGADALRVARQLPHPDLILLADELPDMDGYSLSHDIRSNFLTADIGLIFLCASNSPEDQRHAMREGADDVLAKPVVAEVLLARVGTHLKLRRAQAMLKDQHADFEQLVAKRTREVVGMQDAIVLAMAALAESRDQDTLSHIRRTQHYVAALARELRFKERFTAELTDENIGLIFKAAPLHDIGKVGVPESILLNTGRLSEAEFELMKKHTVYGRDAIDGVERTIGGGNKFLRYAREITYSHQEKWDGSGYPQGLAGEAIPLAARMMALADVYDALISDRPYRPAFTHETAIELIRQGSGEHFDPEVVDAMLVVEEKFKAIAQQFTREPAARL